MLLIVIKTENPLKGTTTFLCAWALVSIINSNNITNYNIILLYLHIQVILKFTDCT